MRLLSARLRYSEKATKFCEISTLLLFYVVPGKSKVDISQNFVAFSEYRSRALKSRNKPDVLRAYIWLRDASYVVYCHVKK